MHKRISDRRSAPRRNNRRWQLRVVSVPSCSHVRTTDIFNYADPRVTENSSSVYSITSDVDDVHCAVVPKQSRTGVTFSVPLSAYIAR